MARDNIKLVGGGKTIYIGTNKVSNNWTNTIRVIKLPTTDTTPNTAQVVNLNKVEDRYTINGYLCNGKLGTEDYTNAIDKKNALKTMFGLRSVLAMTWEGVDIDVAVDKYEISYVSKDDKDDIQDDVAIYDVTISCVNAGDLV